MALNDLIEKLEMEDQKEAMGVLLTNALTHLMFHDTYPKYSLLLGVNWYMLAQVEDNIEHYSPDKGQPMACTARINLKVVASTEDKYYFMPDILKRLENNIPYKDLALLLFSEARILEADRLWPNKEKLSGWYTVDYDGKKLSVFPHARETFEINTVAVTLIKPS